MRKLYFGSSLAALVIAGALGAAYGADYTPVTDARLQNPEPQNWLMTRGNYQGWSYSPLDQINASNVKNLVPVWSVSTGVTSGHEAPPIVNNGVMFVATPYSQVLALDAATGDLLWRYKRKLPEGFAALHNTSRGVGLYGDKVFFPTLDATLVALDAKTGKVDWEAKVEDWKTGYYMTMAPLIVKGKVLVGVAGGEFGVRGFVEAFDANTGKSVWKTYTVPAPGEPGSETWEKADTVEDLRRLHLDDRQLRSGNQHGLLGHGQCVALVRRPAARRQPLYRLHRRARRRHRQDQRALPVPAERVMGLGCDAYADAGRFREGRRQNEGLGDRGAQWIPVLVGARLRRQYFLRGC
ncbi:MAG TPA: PQQ-binding-like beta-propeller repeat protein [Roseiarcus sp.]|nr:PQQ-binding-like beta-propeller repeat protein [Roseiarcus sp.]